MNEIISIYDWEKINRKSDYLLLITKESCDDCKEVEEYLEKNNNKVEKFGGDATKRKTEFEAYVKQEYLKVEERALNDTDTTLVDGDVTVNNDDNTPIIVNENELK